MNTENRIITIIGPHACETEDRILSRKVCDIKKEGKTFWVIKAISKKTKKTLKEVQEFCENSESEVKIYFISPASPANPTKGKTVNKEYFDGDNWEKIPEGISPVTGDGYAFILSKLDLKTDENINIYDYAEYPKEPDMPVIFSNFGSTICAIKKDTSDHPKRMHKNSSGTKNIRTVWAVGTLEKPYYVKVRE